VDAKVIASGNPKLISLLEYWESKRRGRLMPSRADIDVTELRRWMGELHLLDVLQDPLRFVYRVYGTNVAPPRDADMTGRSVDEFPPKLRDLLKPPYLELLAARTPLYRTHVYEAKDRFVRRERLILPLSDNGTNVNMILTGNYPLEDPKPGA
jgi:hypothetical protein